MGEEDEAEEKDEDKDKEEEIPLGILCKEGKMDGLKA